jgi:hypothetical protein
MHWDEGSAHLLDAYCDALEAASPGTTVPAHDGIGRPGHLRDAPYDRRGR